MKSTASRRSCGRTAAPGSRPLPPTRRYCGRTAAPGSRPVPPAPCGRPSPAARRARRSAAASQTSPSPAARPTTRYPCPPVRRRAERPVSVGRSRSSYAAEVLELLSDDHRQPLPRPPLRRPPAGGRTPAPARHRRPARRHGDRPPGGGDRAGRRGPAAPRAQAGECVLGRPAALFRPSLRPVINATGVIIHTNLGRAPLSDDAIAAMAAVSRGYSHLELALEGGERGSRFAHLEGVLRQLTGAEAAIAVNNNASALLLALSALASDGEVVVSRGQAVEIGGGLPPPRAT